MKKQQKQTLIIYKKKFIDWAFDGETTYEIGTDLVNELIKKGKVTHTIEQVLTGMGYLPFNLIKNKEVLWAGKKYVDTTDNTDIDNAEDYILIFDDTVKKGKT